MRSRRSTRSSKKKDKGTLTRVSLFLFPLALVLLSGCARSRPQVAAAPLPPNPLQQLQSTIDTLIDQPGHQRGLWGIVVQSLARNDRLYERNPRALFVPASTMKLVTTAIASEAVGWDYRFETRLLASGSIGGGVLHGDLVIIGSGDPSTLGRAGDDPFPAWIEALRSRGITRIEGRVIADDDALEEPRPGYIWSWDDLGFAYGAIPGALNLAENTIQLVVSPASIEGLPPIVEAPANARDFIVMNRAVTAAANTPETLWPEFPPGEANLTLNGTIPIGSKPVVVSAAAGNPTQWFARSFRNRMLAAGIDVTGAAVDVDDLPVKPGWADAVELHVHRSKPLSEIAKPLVKDSINLYAEAALHLATGRDGARTTGMALDAARQRLETWGIPKEGIQIVDGSGLSRRDVIAPETLLVVLQRFHDATGASPFMQTLAIAGVDGSLAARMKGTAAEGNAVGKTGSMSNIRTFAGYVKTADGEPLAFAIMANNFDGPGSGVTATIDRIVVTLATFSRVRPGSDRGQTGVRPGSDQGQSGVRAGSDRGQTRVRAGSEQRCEVTQGLGTSGSQGLRRVAVSALCQLTFYNAPSGCEDVVDRALEPAALRHVGFTAAAAAEPLCE
jgi:D-alanyl-D-alanine carboxypeptidase/D-alanyl-D-alanine-endopeptidase (penicillin-binding protein 4)